MIQITSRDFRNQLAAMFSLAENGEQVLIRRRGKTSFLLTPVYEDDFALTPELEKRIEDAQQAYREGRTTSCRTPDELHKFLDSL